MATQRQGPAKGTSTEHSLSSSVDTSTTIGNSCSKSVDDAETATAADDADTASAATNRSRSVDDADKLAGSGQDFGF